MARASDELTLPAGRHLCEQGSVGREAFVIVGGSAEVRRNDRKVATLGPGDCVGELALLDHGPRTATVRAIDDVRVLEIPAERFREVALERPGLIEHISAVVATRRTGLDQARTAAASTPTAVVARTSLFVRIQKFLHLPS